MVKHSWLPMAASILGMCAAACGASHDRHVQAVPAPPPPPAAVAPAPQAPPPDPVVALVAQSESLFTEGQHDLDLGHLDQARIHFNRAIDVLLNAPGGARTEPRLRAQFDKLVDRISALEVAALASGDGFTEKPSEPASIDELLALSSTFDKPTPRTATTEAVQIDLTQHAPDIPIPMNDRVLSYVELFQGRLHDYIQAGLERGSQYLPMIQDVFRAEGLPLDLAYVPLIESAFKPNALSRASARGVWQFMHGTAVENGLQHERRREVSQDPQPHLRR
jgi:membrane-bound lytic murein transglycosylase D